MTPDKRTQVYRFFRIIFTEKPNKEMLNSFRQEGVVELLSALDVNCNELNDDCIEDLVKDYNQLFDVPEKHLSLNESVHREKNPRFWGDDTVDVKNYIESLGLTLSENWGKFPDHIAVEFEIMQKLAEKEEKVNRHGDDKSVLKCRSFSIKFLNEHLLAWIPDLCVKIEEQAETSFYKSIGKLVREFIVYDCEMLNNQD